MSERASNELTLALRRRRGTFLRWLRGNVVGMVTFGLVEDDTWEPQRFEVVITDRHSGTVVSRVPAGSSPQEAQGLLDILSQRALDMSRGEFLRDYGDARKSE